MRRVRVAVADDDAMFRDALVEVIAADERFELVGVASSCAEIVAVVLAQQPDLVVLDVQMPGGGVEAARQICDASPRRPTIVAVSAQSGAPAMLEMVRAGASGYLAKGKIGAYLPDVLLRCSEGHVVLAAPGASEVLRTLAGPWPKAEVRPPRLAE